MCRKPRRLSGVFICRSALSPVTLLQNLTCTPLQQTPGDILVFLSGREEIDRCLEILSEMLPTYVRLFDEFILLLMTYHRLPRHAKRMSLLALHAGLTTDEQLRVFEPPERGSRKVIIATNIAEVQRYLEW